ncbi:MAG TPA: ferritin-like domain-containing protein [Thermoleophilaceae bacterium]|nr:ferritin-like domain-containing protein [Thermoleophilaceae bacterium]
MPARLTRRAALGGAAAVTLASCGGSDPPPTDGPEAGSGAALLGSAAALEHAAAAAWGAIGEQLRGHARGYARTIRAREERHAERISELIRELGGEPPVGRPAEEYTPQFPLMRNEEEALRFAADLEEQLVRAHLDALQTLPREDQRRTVAEIAAEEGEDLAVVYAVSGEPAAQLPFVTGTQ